MPVKNHTWKSIYHQRFKTTEQRFWEKVSIGDENECWLWNAGKYKSGYGGFGFRNKHHKAHRVAWILTNGEIPDGQCVCHRCDVPLCMNPAHLFLGTSAENTADRVAKGRNARRDGIHNPNAKLSDIEVRIIRIYGSVIQQKALGKHLGISGSHVSSIISGRRRALA